MWAVNNLDQILMGCRNNWIWTDSVNVALYVSIYVEIIMMPFQISFLPHSTKGGLRVLRLMGYFVYMPSVRLLFTGGHLQENANISHFQ